MAERSSSVAVFICSSDSRRDILERVLPALLKYWSDCPYPIYVGLNSTFEKFTAVISLIAPKSDWRGEVTAQIRQISEPYLIVVLDDFLFQKSADQSRLSILVDQGTQRDLPYLRLLPLGISLIGRLKALIGIGGGTADIEPIRGGRPFYSSLQIALWKKRHLLSMLEQPGSIWEFEHQRVPGAIHYAIAEPAPFYYGHLVEKGRWLPNAAKLLSTAGLPPDLGARRVWSGWLKVKLLVDEIRFFLLGHAIH